MQFGGSWFVVRGSWSSFFMYLQYCGKIFVGNCSDRLLLSSSPPSILKIIMPRKRASESVQEGSTCKQRGRSKNNNASEESIRVRPRR